MRRLRAGGAIRREQPVTFRFDGMTYTGFAGDTLASALLGAGVDIVTRSVAAARPRGIMAARLEEATGFVQLVSPGATEPLVRASAVLLEDGLAAESRGVRGVLHELPDTARFDKRYVHADVCVVGAGPAGLMAAQLASASGARVLLVDADPSPGGALLRDGEAIDGGPATRWVAEAWASLGERPEVRRLAHTTAVSSLDHGGLVLVQRLGAPRVGRDATRPEMRVWQVRARAVILATGMLERPIVFQDNDRPGIILASAAREYLERHAVAPRTGLVFTTTDDGYRTALAWASAGVEVAAVVDPRASTAGVWRRRAEAAGVWCVAPGVVEGTVGDANGRLQAVRIRTGRGLREIAADCLAVSGGYEPAMALHTERRGATRHDAWWGAALPDRSLPGMYLAGGVRGCRTTAECLADGARAAREALSAIGLAPAAMPVPAAADDREEEPVQLWHVPAPDGDETRSFVDLHRDATVAGIGRAVDAGLRHIEHVKRYTLIGTGVEQGRSARTNAGVVTAALTDNPVALVGTSGSRPPVEPVAFAALAGAASGPMFSPVRTTAIHASHVALGAVFETAGPWLRPSRYPRDGETVAGTVGREIRAVRYGVGLMDASTLGKIDVRGPDATWFLEQLYCNRIATIPVGKGRYSVMCRLDGTVFDDGVVLRLEENRYFVTASTGHAAAVVDWFDEWLQTEWPERRVWVTPVTEQYATVVLAGPRAREVMSILAPGIDVSRGGFPFLAVRHGLVAGIPGSQVARVSFSGELAFEVSVPWDRGQQLWEAAMNAGAPWRITPYGLDALQVLRMEKGYIIVGQDTDATTTPEDAGLGWLVAGNKPFVGRRSLARPAQRRTDRPHLVGFEVEGERVLPEGAALTRAVHEPPMTNEGWVTSSGWSATLGRSLGLAMVRGGRERIGEELLVPLDDAVVRVRLVPPVHVDPEGAKRDGWEDSDR